MRIFKCDNCNSTYHTTKNNELVLFVCCGQRMTETTTYPTPLPGQLTMFEQQALSKKDECFACGNKTNRQGLMLHRYDCTENINMTQPQVQQVNRPQEIQHNQHYECKVCGNTPDEEGTLHHGKGCYVLDEDGRGEEYIPECDKIQSYVWGAQAENRFFAWPRWLQKKWCDGAIKYSDNHLSVMTMTGLWHHLQPGDEIKLNSGDEIGIIPSYLKEVPQQASPLPELTFDKALAAAKNCIGLYRGGYTLPGDEPKLQAFQHGMQTVINMLEGLQKEIQPCPTTQT